MRLEKVTQQDVQSRVEVAVNFKLGKNSKSEFVFNLKVDKWEPSEDYIVRAHLDLDGSGKVKKGDYITTQAYPVLTRGYGDNVSLQLKKVL